MAQTITEPALTTEEIARVRQAVMRLSRRLRQQSGGVTPSQLAVLGSLDKHGEMTLGELAEAEAVSPPAISRTVKVLEEDGLLARSTPEDDRRTARVRLTPKAVRLIDNIRRQRDAWLAERIGRLSPRTLADLLKGVGAIEEVLELK